MNFTTNIYYHCIAKKCEIMYTDTDSLIYRIECDDVYEQIKCDITKFDMNDYSINNVYGISLANKKGLMKDENNGAILTELVALRCTARKIHRTTCRYVHDRYKRVASWNHFV